nr:hypothetical protein Iba_chr11bCG9480 [Ipomoea batatas]
MKSTSQGTGNAYVNIRPGGDEACLAITSRYRRRDNGLEPLVLSQEEAICFVQTKSQVAYSSAKFDASELAKNSENGKDEQSSGFGAAGGAEGVAVEVMPLRFPRQFGDQNRHAQTNREDEVGAGPELVNAAEAPSQELDAERHEAEDDGVEQEPQRAGVDSAVVEAAVADLAAVDLLGHPVGVVEQEGEPGEPVEERDEEEHPHWPRQLALPHRRQGQGGYGEQQRDGDEETALQIGAVDVAGFRLREGEDLIESRHVICDVENPEAGDENGNGTGLRAFAEGVAGGMADVGGEADEDNGNVTDEGLDDHAGDGPTEPDEGGELVLDPQQLDVGEMVVQVEVIDANLDNESMAIHASLSLSYSSCAS